MDSDVDFFKDVLEGEEIPIELLDEISLPSKTQLSERSQFLYQETYVGFKQWMDDKKYEKITEPMLLEYFEEISEKLKSSTLWARFSMLKNKILENDNLCIGDYKNLLKFLKVKSIGYKRKESNFLSPDEIKDFLTKAPDTLFLATKVALIFGVCGACRTEELPRITINDIKDHNDLYLVTVRGTGTNLTRSFTIDGDFYKTVQKYLDMRPNNVHTDRAFLNYQNGKCTTQVIGKNKFGRMPKEIAKFLNLPDSDSYTGHSFRKTSNLLASSSLSRRRAMNHHITSSSILNSEQTSEYYEPLQKRVRENSTFDSEFVEIKTEIPDEEDSNDPLNHGDEEVDTKMHEVMLKESHEEEDQTDVFSMLYSENLNNLLPNERWGIHKQSAIGDKMSAIVFSIIDYISNDLRLAPVYYKQLILYENLNAEIFFYNILRSEFSTSISSVKELRNLIKKVDDTNLCRGGPSVLLYEDVVTNIARKEEASNRWRHTSCLVVLDKGVCCKMCFSLHETLRKLANQTT